MQVIDSTQLALVQLDKAPRFEVELLEAVDILGGDGLTTGQSMSSMSLRILRSSKCTWNLTVTFTWPFPACYMPFSAFQCLSVPFSASQGHLAAASKRKRQSQIAECLSCTRRVSDRPHGGLPWLPVQWRADPCRWRQHVEAAEPHMAR